VITTKRFNDSIRSVSKISLDSELITRHLKKVLEKAPKVLNVLLSSTPLLRLFHAPWLVLAGRGMDLLEQWKKGSGPSGYSGAEGAL